MSTAVIIWAHGSRDPAWQDNIHAMAQAMREREPNKAVACAYLELCEPDLVQAAAPLIAQGVDHVRVLPLFFGIGKHIRADLPERIAALQQAYPELGVTLLPAAGDDAGVRAAVAQLGLQGRA
jgi:sirohydrochlorin cobaltochelatase